MYQNYNNVKCSFFFKGINIYLELCWIFHGYITVSYFNLLYIYFEYAVQMLPCDAAIVLVFRRSDVTF